MPTYEYHCRSCDNRFEKVQKISDDPVVECPKCGAKAERLISGGAGLLFKGSGFHTTDYRSASYKNAAENEKKTSEPSADVSRSSIKGKKGAQKTESQKPGPKKDGD